MTSRFQPLRRVRYNVGEAQTYSVGERLIGTVPADEMRNRLEFLSHWGASDR